MPCWTPSAANERRRMNLAPTTSTIDWWRYRIWCRWRLPRSNTNANFMLNILCHVNGRLDIRVVARWPALWESCQLHDVLRVQPDGHLKRDSTHHQDAMRKQGDGGSSNSIARWASGIITDALRWLACVVYIYGRKRGLDIRHGCGRWWYMNADATGRHHDFIEAEEKCKSIMSTGSIGDQQGNKVTGLVRISFLNLIYNGCERG